MSIETPDDNDIDLDVFAAEFFGQKTAPAEQASPEETDKDKHVDTVDAPASDEAITDDDTVETDDDDTDEPVVELEPKKKSRYQERIDELTAKAREAERRNTDLETKLNELIAGQNKKDTPAASKPVDLSEPKPTDLKDDGTEKYPLGEYDPQYQEDRIRHIIERESKAVREREESEKQVREFQQQEEALMSSWNEKLNSAEEETYPDIREKNALLEDTFRSIDPNYGKYLAATIMSMEFGPDVLYYLGNNVEKAKKIVNSGATKATIALGRLEAKFADAAAEKQISKPRVSAAPVPPPKNKGSAVALPEIADDTDDLDAFSAKFFKKKK